MDICPNKFDETINDIFSYVDDFDEIYTELQKRMSEYKLSKFRELTSLTCLKNDLTDQMSNFFSENQTVDGMLEVGYPGRFVKSFKKILNLKGPIDTLYVKDSSKINDIIESESLLGYKRYILDYSLEKKPKITSKYELITCFVGLHHFKDPEEFVKMISESLKDNGKFILIDHDIIDEKTLKMANMAHTIFNVTKNVSLEDEKSEIRNFKSIDEWAKILSKYNLEIQPQRFVRENDPSKNTMVCFIKKQGKTEYLYDYRTYMTTIEWRNVDMALEFANFLKKGHSINNYPYVSQLYQFWKIYYHSLRLAYRSSSFSFFSEFNIMNLFILLTTSIELLYKKLFSSILFLKLSNDSNKTEFQQYVSNLYLDYANFIPKTPFYLYNFNEKIIPLFKHFLKNCETFTDIITFFITLFDLSIKSIPTYPIRKYYSTVNIRRFITVEIHEKQEKQEKQESIKEFIHKNNLEFKIENGNYLIQFPKYEELNKLIKKLPKSCELISIGGQNYVQIDVLSNESSNKSNESLVKEYSYNNSIDNNNIDIMTVYVPDLLSVIDHYDVKFIHDF